MAVKAHWPNCLVQFEDFSNDHCFTLLEKYSQRLLCFNDDIQGTGAVIAAGFLNALKIAALDPREVRVVFFGAGSAGVGVARQITLCLIERFGMTPEECARMFYMVDSKGLLSAARTKTEGFASFKIPYARADVPEGLVDLVDVVKFAKPHALIGLSGKPNAFSDEVLALMGTLNQRPIVFPLSNPTNNMECSAHSAFTLTEGRVIFASGSPQPVVEVGGVSYKPSQGNNMYVFPGLGFGAWLARARLVSDEMLVAASLVLADATSEEALAAGRLYPALDDARAVSAAIAAGVAACAVRTGVARADMAEDLPAFVAASMYVPSYKQINE
eukprot:GHVT01098272.1.p1 GENE.GHVT01098272.1~~GHVT01098272.1.p1  ORF type:complete len:329 (-),score=75.99 GHVT01098272.1:329-1315(-)